MDEWPTRDLALVYLVIVAVLTSPVWLVFIIRSAIHIGKPLAGQARKRLAALQRPCRAAARPPVQPAPATPSSSRAHHAVAGQPGAGRTEAATPFSTPGRIRAPSDDDPQDYGWDEELLERCAANSQYLSSPQALQQSPLYQRHIRARSVRREEAIERQLRVYQALRKTDAEGFSRLLTRQVQSFDEQPPPAWQAGAEYLLRTATSTTLLLLPWIRPQALPIKLHPAPAAAVWVLLTLWSAWHSCTSPLACAWSIYTTAGPYSMAAGGWLVLALQLLELLFLLLTVGTGALPSLAMRLLLPARQTAVERLLGVLPLQQVVQASAFDPDSEPLYDRDL